ncbi:hypothetical protein MCEMRE191_01386 [Candidatus Nanopelagicaceae bacterium]
MMLNDPAMILSSTIQGAATAISIIAGFAIQQFLSAQSAKDNAQFELGILQQKIEKVLREISKFQSELQEVAVDIYKPKVLGLIEINPNYNAKEIWAQLTTNDQEAFSLQQVEIIKNEIEIALEEISSKAQSGLIPQISKEQLISLGFDLGKIDVEIYLSAIALYRIRNNQNWLSKFPGYRNALLGLSSFNLSLIEKQSYLYRDIDEANADLGQLYEELAIWSGRRELAAKSFSTKSFAGHSIFIILVGIGIPGFLLARQNLSNSHNYRVLYISLLFGVLIIAVSYFLQIFRMRLNKSK